MMKQIAVIGASGFVGSKVVKELSDRGFAVKAIARNTDKIIHLPNVTLVSVDVNDVNLLIDVLRGSDAVISTFNAGWTNPNIYEDFLKGAHAIEKAVEASGVKRFITVGGAGSLQDKDGNQLVDSPDFSADFKQGALAARDYLNDIRKNNTLDWTFFSPAIEMHQGTSGVRKGSYRTAENHPVFDENGRSIISVEDVAVALVDELENGKFIKKRFTAGY